MSGARAEIGIDFDAKEITKGLQEINRTIENQLSEIAASFEIFSKIGEGIQAVVEVLADFAKAAAEVEVIERRAAQVLIGTNKLRVDQVGHLKALNSERQRLLGIDADEQLKLQTRLAQMGVEVTRLDEATRATIGLANATGQDLAAAGTTVAKVFSGNIQVLARMGVQVDSVNEAHAKLAEFYGATVSEVGSYTREVSALSAAWGDLEESLGGLVLAGGAGGGLIGRVTTALEGLGNFINGPYFYGAIRNLIQFGEAISPLRGFLSSVTGAAAFANSTDFGLRPGAVLDVLAPAPFSPAFDFAASQNDMANQAAALARPNGIGGRGGGRASGRGGGGARAGEGMGAFAGAALTDLSGVDPNSMDAIALLFGSTETRSAAADQAIAENAQFFEQYRAGLEAETQKVAEQQEAYAAILSGSLNVISGALTQMFVDVFSGAKSAGEAVLGLVGNIISGIGQMLVQLGTAAVLAGTLGTVVPIFAGLTGGPAGIAAGAAMIVGGAAMIGVGAALGGSGGGAGAKAPARGAGGGASRGGPRFGGFQGDGADLPPSLLGGPAGSGGAIVVNFNGPVGDPRATARSLADVLRARDPLIGGGW